jgi:hypothetical protein
LHKYVTYFSLNEFAWKTSVMPGEFIFVCEIRNPAHKILDIPDLTPDFGGNAELRSRLEELPA